MAASRSSGARADAVLTRGLTLIELLVVTGIIVIISSIILANNNRFGGSVLLQNLVYDMALTARQAQAYGIAVKQYTTNNFASAYGVHFQMNTVAGTRDAFVLFADAVTVNGQYDCSTPSNPTPSTCELVNAYQLQSGYHVTDICAPKDQAEPCGHSVLDVTFKRPDPDAYIRADGTLYESARVYVSSPRGDIKSVIFEDSGQIAVQ